MSLFTKVLHFHASVSCRPDQSGIWRYTRVGHERNVHSVIPICSGVEQANLTASSLCIARDCQSRATSPTNGCTNIMETQCKQPFQVRHAHAPTKKRKETRRRLTLSRRPKQDNPPTQPLPLHNLSSRHRSRHGRNSDQIMPAGMTNSSQSI